MSRANPICWRDLARLLLLGAVWVACLAVPSAPARAAQEVDLHNLKWYVHADLIDAGAGQDLAFWQAVLDDSVDIANGLVEGGQGPADTVCCSRMGRTVEVAVFGSPGDGLDVIDNSNLNDIIRHGNGGSSAYLVDSIVECGPAGPAIGCAEKPDCAPTPNFNDDPNLWMIVTVDSFDAGTLGTVIAHERGHNGCLAHTASVECQVMQATIFSPGLGGCFTANECNRFASARTETSSGLECGCHETNGSGPVADGEICPEVVGGVCSGGLCGSITGDAGLSLLAAAAPGTSGGGPPDDALRISALPGDWEVVAQFAPTADDIRGLAYATDSETLYGVVPTVADDRLVTIDPETGMIQATVGVIANGSDEFVSLAYDPGASSGPGDDRLIVLEAASVGMSEFRWIDPDSPNTASFLGTVDFSPAFLVTGMAYDSIHDLLYLSTPFAAGILEMDPASCSPSPCNTTGLPGSGSLFRTDSSLAFSEKTGMLYLVGTAFNGQRTFYNVIDPTTGAFTKTVSLDVFTPGGLAAVPEPVAGPALVGGLLALSWAARRRDRRVSPRV